MRAKKAWGLNYVGWGVFVLLLANIMALPVLTLIAFVQADLDPQSPTFATDLPDAILGAATSLPGVAVSLLTMWVAFVGVPVRASYRHGHRSLAKDFGLRFHKFDPLLGLGLAVVMQVVMIGTSFLLNQTSLNLEAADNTGQVSDKVGIALIVMILSASLGAPLTEELFFRGLVLRAALRTFARRDLAPTLAGVTEKYSAPVSATRQKVGTVAALLLSTVFFGVLHFQMGVDAAGNEAFTAGSVVLMCQTGVLGLVFALIALRTRRLGINICAHVAFNSISLALVFLTR